MRDDRLTLHCHRLPIWAGGGVRRLLLVCFGLVAALLVYSSLNAHLWAQYRRMVEVCWNGTRDLSDLDHVIQDRTLAWGSDGLFEQYAFVDASLIHYPLGLTGTTEIVERWLVLVSATLFLFLGCYAIVSLTWRRCVRHRLSGLDPMFYRLPSIRRAQCRIIERSFVVAFLALPIAAGLSWYIFYDRIQTSFERENGSTRWPRYLYQSFSPRGEDWVFIAVCVLGSVSWYAWLASRRLIRGLDLQIVEPFHRLCSNCGYPLASVSGPCPECGLSKGEPARPEGWLTPRRGALGVALLVLATATAGVLIFRGKYEGYVYEPHWLTMRGHTKKFDPDLYLLPNRPAMLRWDGVEVWIVAQHQEYGQWPTRLDIYYIDSPVVVCKVGKDPAFVVERIVPRHEGPDRLIVGGRETLMWNLSLNPPIPWIRTALYALSVRVQPEAVQGFGLSDPLTPEAEAFLEEVRMTVGGPNGQSTD